MPRTATETEVEQKPVYKLVSVQALVPKMQRYALRIEPHHDPKEPKVVPIRNGDYQLNVIRGHFWIVPEAIVTVLKDAVGDRVDEEGRTVATGIKSYPFTAFKVGSNPPAADALPIGTLVNEDGEKTELQKATYQ